MSRPHRATSSSDPSWLSLAPVALPRRRDPPSRRPTRTGRSRRSRSTNGRSGSAARPRRRSTPRASTGTRCPASVGTSRPKLEEKELAGKFPVAPISVVQFFGEPCQDVDVDLRVKKGTFLAHWPPGTERSGRLQWFKSDLLASPPAGHPAELPPGEPLVPEAPRQDEAALYLKHESHFERFLAYDTELTIPIPVKIRGGPDEYTLQNLTDRRLLDVAVIAPTDGGLPRRLARRAPHGGPRRSTADEETAKDEGEGEGEGQGEARGRRRRRPRRSSRRPRPKRRRTRTRRRTSPSPCRPRGTRTSGPGSTRS